MLPVEPFVDFIEKNKLFAKQHRILVAVSGGIDSVLLAHLLQAAGYNFGIAHCNFQLRGEESDADQIFVAELADQLGVPVYITKFDTRSYAAEKKISIQMAARDLRYQWFRQISQEAGYDVIALAHHQNDAIETILFNLTRGTGIAGLHGILPKNGTLVRPMLYLNRGEIAAIVEENKLPYREDSSNASAKYARNKIRLEVIPKLKELNPVLEDTFEQNLEHFRGLEELLGQTLSGLRETLLIPRNDAIYIAIDSVKKLKPQSLLLYGLLHDFGFNKSTVSDIIGALDKHSGRVFESANYRLLLDRGCLILTKRIDHLPAVGIISNDDRELTFGDLQLRIKHPDELLVIKNDPLAVAIDAELLVYPLTIRTWHQGDYFYPLGMKTKKKLSDFFVGLKIPLVEKTKVPILLNGNGDIIWVAGYRPDNRYKISSKTKKVTIFELGSIW